MIDSVLIGCCCIWGGGLAKQLDYDRGDVKWKRVRLLDFKNGSDFAGPFVLYWVIGELADDTEILSRWDFLGFCHVLLLLLLVFFCRFTGFCAERLT